MLSNCEILLQLSFSPHLLITKLSGSSQDEEERPSSFLLSGVSGNLTTLPYSSFPCGWAFRLFQCPLQQTILLGSSWMCSLGHMGRCFLGDTPRGWMALQRAHLWPSPFVSEEDWDLEGSPRESGAEKREESGSADLPAPSRPRATVLGLLISAAGRQRSSCISFTVPDT